MDLSPAAAATRSVRGEEYTRVRVDVAASELQVGEELARGGAATVYRGQFEGCAVAIKKPVLSTRADMDRYHKELQLVRCARAPRWGGLRERPGLCSLLRCVLTRAAALQLARARQRAQPRGGARVAARVLPHLPADGKQATRTRSCVGAPSLARRR